MRQIFNLIGAATIIVCITLLSCEKDDNTDLGNNKNNLSNPAEEIGWLKEAINNVKQDQYAYYVMAKYKGEIVFYYGNCDPAANYVSFIKDFSGNNLGYTNDLYDELSDITILWKHEESKCNFK